ncbi:hypothetical protein BK128_21605 [Viridibacillus sp. FSL H7-0596]|nr:hypothetical protein BK128_21605 [Viridibacillus sp. FSL H7-0596]
MHKIDSNELSKYPIKKGVIKVIVLDGVENEGYSAELPGHGDTLIHTQKGTFHKINFVDEHLIKLIK